MTKLSLIMACVLFVLVMLAFGFGVSGGSAFPLLFAILCGAPMMMFFMGLAVGSGLNKYKIVPTSKVGKAGRIKRQPETSFR